MKKRLRPLIIFMIILLLSSGCGRNTPKAAAPADPALEPQISASADTDETSLVSIGPPVQEIYDPNQPQQSNQMVYVTTDAGLNYHRVGCKYLSKGKIALSIDEAKEEGYTPCPVCKPPQ